MKASSAKLSTLYDAEEASAILKLLITSKTTLSNTSILLNAELSEKEVEELTPLVSRLEKAEPVQYILGETEFYGLTFKVQEGVLIPRPETEELVDYIVKKHSQQDFQKVIDCCTGSGCIAISLEKNLKSSEVYALEMSQKALKIAAENIEKNESKVSLIEQDLLKNAELPTKNFDLLVSNPPYVTQKERNLMHSNVLDFEPDLALFVEDDDPLLFYRVLFQKGQKWLKKGGWIYFEINEQFGDELVKLANALKWTTPRVWKDSQGKDRFFEAQLLR